MNQDLSEIIDRCTTSANAAQRGDLMALAQLHCDLEAVSITEGPQKNTQCEYSAAAQRAARLVEKLVQNDVEDTASAIREVGRQVLEIRALFLGPSSAPPGTIHTVTKPNTIKNEAGPATTIEKAISEGDAPLALEFVSEATTHLNLVEAGLLKLETDPGNLAELNALFRAFHTIKGVAGFLELKQIGELTHATEPVLDLARKGKLKFSGPRLDIVLEAHDVMKQMVSAVQTAANARQAPPEQEGLEDLLQRLDDAIHENETVTPNANRVVSSNTAVASENPTLPASASAAASRASVPPLGATTGTFGGEGAVKVATARLDALINAVGELVIAHAMVSQDVGAGALAGNQRLARDLSHLGKITRGLQDLSMAMRMVPVASVFQKMARLARDIARKAGKEVEFIQIGRETELDRNVVDAISDPLVHMVRNAVDHGLESPEERIKAGKPREGKLSLNAFHQAGNVVIEITDDGKGLDCKKILQKAVSAGLVQEGQELTEQQIFQLIFHPGLSTVETVTDLSGRGVGMDVVRKNVEALRGRIEIASTPGKGSCFTVRLPLTLAVIDGLIVTVGTNRYIIPIISIEQSIRPLASQLSKLPGKGEMCLVRDRLLPLVRLHLLFDVKPLIEDPTSGLVVIVQDGTERCCLLVDELIGQQQVVIKSMGKEIGNLPGIAGSAILGDGNVSLILDVSGIIQASSRHGLQKPSNSLG